jgi:hypothetical protein
MTATEYQVRVAEVLNLFDIEAVGDETGIRYGDEGVALEDQPLEAAVRILIGKRFGMPEARLPGPHVEDVMAVDGSFEALLSVLTAVRNSFMQRRLGATVDQVDAGGARQSAEVMVSHSDRTWTITDENKTWSFTPAHGGRIEYGTGEVEQAPRDRDDYLPPEVALFFPLSMRIWGGTADDFRVAGAEADGEGVRLALVSIEDPRFTGSAFVNTKYGVVTEYETPARRYSLRDLSWLPHR